MLVVIFFSYFSYNLTSELSDERNKTRKENTMDFRKKAGVPLVGLMLIMCAVVIVSCGYMIITHFQRAETDDEITMPAETIQFTGVTGINLVEIGEFRITAYCACEKCCGQWAKNRPVDADGNQIVYTASSDVAEAGWTVAADTSVLPFGTHIWIDGHEYEVQDRGSAITDRSIDIYFDNHEDALQFGVKNLSVFVDRDQIDKIEIWQ